ncbi:hypothetical protein N665_0383s0079 [Sinapis alba]|nr:hypothetical protein N665_0383s0079 [Sinapis alba]
MFTTLLIHDIISGKNQNLGLIPLLDFTVNDISSKSTTDLDHSFSNKFGLSQDMYTPEKLKVKDWSLRVRNVQCMDELILLVLELDCGTVLELYLHLQAT